MPNSFFTVCRPSSPGLNQLPVEKNKFMPGGSLKKSCIGFYFIVKDGFNGLIRLKIKNYFGPDLYRFSLS
ncbi:hypothetical protein [Dethiosulfatarculus sandiegensis]|uniref:Uncharacterized protein n=1 Tax=Dethiosulfatarculus sandiegensis TaxID=1429043 RepID=A0A0D2GDG9_9BACT|nr:hypothetical protein [Dethiosulfatarculus sandiegensis]KIX12992.1 hypothetical protein X474_16215 [Dethiosulfatarculus sandiegensis]